MSHTCAHGQGSATRSVGLAFLLLASLFSVLPVEASSHTFGTIEVFSDQSSSTVVDTTTTGPVTANLTIQRNTTIGDASLHITYDVMDDSPGELTLDLDGDGQYEWHLGGGDDGDLGAQNRFVGGVASTSIAASGNLTWLPTGAWRLPRMATMATTDITVDFDPTLAARFSNLGSITDLAVGDMDGDGREDAVYLVQNHVGMNSTAWPHIGWLRWNAATASINTSWIPTCADADRLILGDANGDGRSDVLAVASSVNTLCQHLSGTSAWSYSVNLSMDAQFSDALLTDLDADAQDDLVWIEEDGTLGARLFSGGAFATAANGITTTVASGSQMPGGTDFKSVAAGAFYGAGTTIVVSEGAMMTEYNTLWNFSSNNWQLSTEEFECIGGAMQVIDWNADGNDDLIGTESNGACLATWNGTAWDTNSLSFIGLTNFTVGDHDRDGAVDVFRTNPGNPDGSDATVTGSLEAHSFDGNGGVFSNSTSFNPHTSPRDLVFADLDGDGLAEQIVASGESSPGLWIGAWHGIEWDLEGDGVAEMSIEGYVNSTYPMNVTDQGMLVTSVAAELISSQTSYDHYETPWSNLAPVTRSQGAGSIGQSSLNMTYTATFTIEANPMNTNLSNVLNLHMLPGSGDIIMPLNLTSTRNGTVTLDSVHIEWVAGATNIAVPDAPFLSLGFVDHSMVILNWTNTTSLADFISYEVFRAPAGSQISITQPALAMVNENGYIDMNGVTNADWDYAVRSVHAFEIHSLLSNILTIQVPDTPPPVDTTPPDAPEVSLADVPGDSGGVLNLSFIASTASDLAYTLIFFENSEFSDATGLTPSANLTAGDPTTSFLLTGLADGEDHWAAAVAVDGDDNAWWNVTAVGPAHSTNDTTRSSLITLGVTGAGDYDDGVHSGVHVKAGSPFSFAIQLSTEGAPLAGETVDLTLTMGTGEMTLPLLTDGTGSVSHGWTDWLQFVSEAGAYGGVIGISASWPGGTYGAGDQTVAPTSAATTVVVTVDATLATSTPSIQLDEDGRGTAVISLTTPLGFEQAVIDGLTLDWQVGNGTTVFGASGQVQVGLAGAASIPIDYLTGGWLDITAQAPWWLSVESSPLRIDTYPPPPPPPEPEPEPDPELDWLQVQCDQDDWDIVKNSSQVQSDLDTYSMHCSLMNPNNISVQTTFDFAYSEQIPTFSNDLTGTHIWIENETSLDLVIRPDSWGDGVTLTNGTITLTITVNATDWGGAVDVLILPYIFTDALEPEPSNGSGGSQGEADGSEEGSNTLLIVVLAALVLAVGAFIGLRMVMRTPENEDEGDEDDEDNEGDGNDEFDWAEKETNSIRTSLNFDELPTGRSLEELTTRGEGAPKVSMTKPKRADRTPGSRPTPVAQLIKDIPESNSEPEPEPEEDWDYTQDEDYHIDEEGIEWWKDEVGQWWFKYPEEEDWEALED